MCIKFAKIQSTSSNSTCQLVRRPIYQKDNLSKSVDVSSDH